MDELAFLIRNYDGKAMKFRKVECQLGCQPSSGVACGVAIWKPHAIFVGIHNLSV